LIGSKTISSGSSLRIDSDIFEPINSSLPRVVCFSSPKNSKVPATRSPRHCSLWQSPPPPSTLISSTAAAASLSATHGSPLPPHLWFHLDYDCLKVIAWNVIAWFLCASKWLFDFISLEMWLLLLGMWLLDYYVLQNCYLVS
jgi:hypothetical protein